MLHPDSLVHHWPGHEPYVVQARSRSMQQCPRKTRDVLSLSGRGPIESLLYSTDTSVDVTGASHALSYSCCEYRACSFIPS